MVFALLFQLSTAFAQTSFSEPLVYFERGDYDRPRCLVVPGGEKNLFFKWKESDHYSREILAKVSSSDCENWKWIKETKLGWKPLSDTATTFEGIEITDQLKERLFTIRQGGRDFVPSYWSAKDYLQFNPIKEYTRATNIELTQKFGHGFSGAIYREWLLSQANNRSIRDQLVRDMKMHLGLGNKKSIEHLRSKMKNTVILVSMGLNWGDTINEKTPNYVIEFFDQMKSLGMQTKILKRNPLGLLHDNIRELEPQVLSEIKSGKDVILFGLCKGAPEIMAATANVLKPYLDSNRKQTKLPEGYGHIAGVMHFSPMFSGIYWADFANQIPGLESLGSVLASQHLIPSVQEFAEWIKPLKTMDTKTVEPLVQQFTREMPSDITYFSAIGVIPGNGLIGANDTTAMNPFIEGNRKFNIAHGANDGFIQYPGLELPQTISENLIQIPMQGSHMLGDGKFEGFNLKKKENVLSLYRSILEIVVGR